MIPLQTVQTKIRGLQTDKSVSHIQWVNQSPACGGKHSIVIS